ncbi:UNVERIFIED_CONTAM: hypothetical protein PYX00_008119 [Menopon gallinae]|uniref:DNA mismatch repair protein S5 domain-containing protein n=1 Tax=Menopon gallinae TaxID=328185 RepID=A0AAW2HMF6_9NEOP
MTDSDSVLIKQIDKNVVNQICSGQVILTLATAVKELIENSIDADATSVQIRLKDYGQESIEVSDNGSGVEEKNFQALTLKHHTSKISDFADVSGVETFGFRGEALSSLCSLSNVTIITKHKDSDSGNRLRFDNNGLITENSKYARQTGTTVILEKIFYTLPVRHKEFVRNIKREFTRMCSVLYAYGLLSTGVSILCTNQVRGKKTTVMQTKGETLKSNITQIFGPKQSQNLLQFEMHLPEEPEENAAEVDETETKSKPDFDLEGFISSCGHGCGRTSPDRQFYYINSRPIDNAKISKLVNDVYHQYNPHQYPFVVLNVKIQMKYVDVNVTPDKRLIFMRNERHLLNVIEASLHKMFQNIPAVITFQNVGVLSGKEESVPLEDVKRESMSAVERLKQFRSGSYSPSTKNAAVKEVKRKPPISTTPSIRNIFVKTEPIHQESMDIKTEEPEPEISTSVEEEVRDVEDVRTEVCVKEIIPDPSSKRKIEEPVETQQPKEIQTIVKRARIDDGLCETAKNNRKSMSLSLTLNQIKDKVKKYITKPKIHAKTNSPSNSFPR